ncbi:CREB-regulated transcription coactivator 2 [Xyrauchen texanus]|uniref:CREB-regulated transcription coactivator 2 n=1 Tax=Xyrauchen texanus TaxID=154827 RepID=UPI002242C159|nr:CREB-regulated transcription coactivator 2 [Xyrauchen texanus]
MRDTKTLYWMFRFIYSRVLPCSKQYSWVLPCSKQYSRVLPCSNQYSRVLPYSKQYSWVLPYSNQYSRVLLYSNQYSRTDSSHSSSVYLSPPPDPSWRRKWNSNFPTDKSQIFHQLPTTALNRTNSDSALHTSVMNPPAADPFSAGHTLPPQNRREMFSYPVPPIEENSPNDGRLLKPWDSRKFPLLSSRPKSCEVPGITVFPSPDQQGGAPHGSTVLNTGGSLPDLTSLHFPSPLPTPLDPDEPGYPPFSGGNSTGNITSTLTQLGINTSNAFHTPGLLPGTLSNPSLHSSLSNPNIQSSLSSHSFPNSLSSASLQSSLSNPSLQSSLSSSPSLRSSLSNQSLQSSLSSQSLQSASSNACYSGSGSFSAQPQVSTSPRRRAQLSPVNLTPDTRRHHPKQFPPTVSSTLTSITQGVALDTSQLQVDQRLSPYAFSQPKQITSVQTGSHTHTVQPTAQLQPHLHNMQNFQMQPQKLPNQNLMSYSPADAEQNQQLQDMQAQTGEPTEQQTAQTRPDPQISPSFSSELDFYNDALFLNSLLNDPYLSLQFTGRHNQNQNQQLEGLNHDVGSGNVLKCPGGSYHSQQGALELLDSTDQQQSPCPSYSDGQHTVPNVILTGDSSSGLSKEITNALSGVPGFEIDPFSSDDPLRMDPLALEGLSMLTDGDLMLADPTVEDSFRSDHLK